VITPGEANEQPTLKHVVERGDLLRDSDRVVGRQRVSHDSGHHALGVQADEQAEHAGMIVDLETLDLEMMLRLAVTGVAELVGQSHVALDLLEEPLI
jgi:hypothetical protein